MCKKFLAGFVVLLFPIFLHAQAVSPVTPKLATITAGGYFSFGGTDYGQNLNNRSHPNAYGIGAYADFDYRIWRDFGIGAEGEARFLNFGTFHGISEDNFLGGPRITYRVGRRLMPYVKLLVGGSRFNFGQSIHPYNQSLYYTTYAFGGGLDFKLNDRWTIRPADFEYQHWDFPPNSLTPWVYSAGVSYRLF